MYKRYYTVEQVRGINKVDQQFETYGEAFDYMCKMYVEDLNKGYRPTLWKILEHSESRYGDSLNIMIKPSWG